MAKRAVPEFLQRNGVMAGLLIVIFLVSRKIFLMEFPITAVNFPDLILGAAAAKNLDIQQLILWYALDVLLLGMVFAYYFHRFGYYDKIIARFRHLEWRENEYLFLGVVLAGQAMMGGFTWLSGAYILSIAVAGIYLRKINPDADKKELLAAWIMAIWIFSIPCIYLSVYLGNLAVCVLFNFVFLIYLCRYSLAEKYSAQIQTKLFPYMLAAIASFSMLFGMEVALVRGYEIIAALMLLPFVAAWVYSHCGDKTFKCDCSKYNFYGTLALMVFSYLPPLGLSFPINYFEIANHGISIEEFVLGMGLPLLHNLDAHMLSNTLPGIIYYSLTGEYTGAIFAPYASIMGAALGIFSLTYLFRRYFSDQEILIMLMLFPWSHLYELFVGFIVFAAFVYWCQKQGIGQSILLMASFTVLALYKIDLGASFGAALLLCPVLYCLVHRQHLVLAKHILTCVLFGICMISLLYMAALHYQIDFVAKLQDFLTAFSSNQHWALGDLGKYSKVYFGYFLLPFAVAAMLWPYIQRLIKGREAIHDWLVIFLYLTFAFGIPRFLTRHTLAEKQVAACGVLLVLTGLLVITYMKKNRAAVFSLIFLLGAVGIFGCRNAAITGGNIMNTDNVIRSVCAHEHRVVKITDDDMKQIEAYREFFADNLAETETYLDFTNQALFYALTQRRNPLYINQIPGMINGYKGQKQALASLESERPKFVTMPYRSRENNSAYFYSFSMDDILNSDRYYLLTDYITENYRPYCAVGDFAVWCLKADYTRLCQRDQAQGIEREYLDYTYEPEVHHKHELGAIPLLWGNGNTDSPSRTDLVAAGDQRYLLTEGNVLGRRGFIVLEIEAGHSSELVCRLQGKSVYPIEYKFRVEAGVHRYRLQVSSDILWYADRLEECLIVNDDVQVKQIFFEVMPDDWQENEK